MKTYEYDLEELFQYHPPKTQERKDQHDRVNQAALEFAKVLHDEVKMKEFKTAIIFAIQQARMLANQAITLQSLNK